MNKSTGFLLAISGLFLGIIIGFLWSPVKKGMHCGYNNGNTYNYNGWNDDDDIYDGLDESDDDILEI